VSVGNRKQPRQSLDDGGRQHSLVVAQQTTDRLKTDDNKNNVAADAVLATGEAGDDEVSNVATSCDGHYVAITNDASCRQPETIVGSPAIRAVRITGCPEAYKRFEEGVFVHYKDVNGKPSYACAFKNMDEDAVHYAFWWAPERKVFMMGPTSASGTMAGFFYVPGDGVDDPTKATMQWVAFDSQSGGWAPFPSMRCFEVVL